MKYILSAVFIIFLTISCKEKKQVINIAEEKLNLLETDKAFSKLSGEKGMKSAFIEYMDSNGVLLRPNHIPIAGANAIDYLIQQDDTAYTITRRPGHSAVSASGDLGYTFGIYSFQPHKADTILYGTYVSIWKKQIDGSWKFVLDTGNEGIGEQ